MTTVVLEDFGCSGHVNKLFHRFLPTTIASLFIAGSVGLPEPVQSQ